MGNQPSEYYGAQCYKCGTCLRPLRNWNHLRQENIEGVTYHVFHDGVYYRRVGENKEYQCRSCFWKPIREREEAERRRREEERRHREEERRRQEQLRQEAERRQQEEERRRREEERRRQEQLRQEAERRRQEEERRRREDQRRHNERREAERRRRQEQEKKAKEEAERQTRNATNNLKKAVNEYLDVKAEDKYREDAEAKQETVQAIYIRQYSTLAPTRDEQLKPEDVSQIDIHKDVPLTRGDVLQLLRQVQLKEDVTEWQINRIPATEVSEFLQTLQEIIFDEWARDPSMVPGVRALKWLQMYFFEIYSQHSLQLDGLNDPSKADLIKVYSVISNAACDLTDNLQLTKVMYILMSKYGLSEPLFFSVEASYRWSQVDEHEKIAIQFIESLIMTGQEQSQHNALVSNWAKVACKILIKYCIPIASNNSDFDYQSAFGKLVENEIWKPGEFIEVISCLGERFSFEDLNLVSIIEQIIANKISCSMVLGDDGTLSSLFQTKSTVEILGNVQSVIEKEGEKNLQELLTEIERQGWATTSVTTRVKTIVFKAQESLATFGYPKCLDQEMANASSSHLINSIKSGDSITSLSDEQLAQSLSALCCAVKKFKCYWPRATQMVSWTMLLLSEDTKGRLIEIATGEGKSCIIAMTAATLALYGKSVDIVTSSPVLAERDSEEWKGFYSLFNLSVNHNIGKTEDNEKLACYKANIVYGTVGGFAADILRHEFQQKNVLGSRQFDAVIVDEVDFMLLDRGVQFTYLSHKTAGLRHLEPVLAMVWNYVSQHKPVVNNDGEVFFTGNQKAFYLALADILDPSVSKIDDPLQFVLMAEEKGLLRKGLSNELAKETTNEGVQSLLADIDVDKMTTFFQLATDYIPYFIELYVLQEDGKIVSVTNTEQEYVEEDSEIPFLLTEKGMCSLLYRHEYSLKNIIVEGVRQHLDLKGCPADDKMSVQCNLKEFVDNRLPVWVENAFIAMKMTEGRHYLIKDGQALPIDYSSTGMVELNKRWGDGLQQFVEIKHRLKISQMSLVTNFMSNIAFFQRYSGNLYGVSGTVGSEKDRVFLERQFKVDFCTVPTHRHKKLYEEDGVLCADEEKWTEKICEKLKYEVEPKQWGRKGRAALVICEDINTATKVSIMIRDRVTKKVSLYTRSDNNEIQTTDTELKSGDVIVATNLAGRGTDINTTKDVNISGGLYVLVTFLPMNSRIERQAFGRTGRKGNPGSAQLIVHPGSLPAGAKQIKYILELKAWRDYRESTRIDITEETEVAECLLKERLFAQYCRILSMTHYQAESSLKEDDRKIVIDSLNEHWGIWLQMQSERVSKFDESSLVKDLKSSITSAANEALKMKSPSANIFHIIKYGNECMFRGEDDHACAFYERAIKLNENWATIAYYNRAYCTLRKGGGGYKEKALHDLEKTQETLANYKGELILTKHLVDHSWSISDSDSGFDQNISIRAQILSFYEKKINETIQKLQDIKGRGWDAEVEATGVFTLVPDSDTSTFQELYELWQLGLLNIFSVKEKPVFCWDALACFFIGLAQVVAGVLVTAFSMGALTTVGTGLISEGISDMMDGVEGMITGEFSWKTWAIGKSMGIAISIAGGGIAKLVSKGATKLGFRTAMKEIKYLPKVASKNVSKKGLSQSLKQNLKNTGKKVAKEMVEEGIARAVTHAEDKLIAEFMKHIENAMQKQVKDDIIKASTSGKLNLKINSVISHYFKGSIVKVDDVAARNSLNMYFKRFGYTVVEEFVNDLEWKSHVSQCIRGLVDKVRSELKGNKQASKKFGPILDAVEAIHIRASVEDGMAKIKQLATEFESRICNEIDEFCARNEITDTEAGNLQMKDVNQLKQEIGDTLARILCQAVTNIFHQQVAGHLFNKIKSKTNRFVRNITQEKLNTRRTEEKIRAGADAFYIAHMPTDSGKHVSSDTQSVHMYINRNLETDSPGSIQDVRILADVHDVKVRILELGGKGKIKHTMTVGSSSCGKIVELVYTRRNKDFPEGHYDVIINGKLIPVDNDGKNCLFHGLAKGLNPDATDDNVRYLANKLKASEITELCKNPQKWSAYVHRAQVVADIRKGHDVLLSGAGWTLKRATGDKNSDIIQMAGIGTVGTYEEQSKRRRMLMKNPKQEKSYGDQTNLDHQPPYSCVRDAKRGRLRIAMAGVGDRNLANHGEGLLVNCVLECHHWAYLTTRNSGKAKAVRSLITEAIGNDDPVAMFKYTFISSSAKFAYEVHKKGGKADRLDDTIRNPKQRAEFDGLGYQNVVDKYYQDFFDGGQGTNPVMTAAQYENISQWIKSKGYNNANDDHYKKMLQI